MKVNDLNFGTHRPDVLHNKQVKQAGNARAQDAASTSPDEATAPSDRVEISNAAREVSQENEDLKREIEFARRALYSIPPLSRERAEALLKQLDQGHYNAPDVRMKLSANLANELNVQTDAPEAGGRGETA